MTLEGGPGEPGRFLYVKELDWQRTCFVTESVNENAPYAMLCCNNFLKH